MSIRTFDTGANRNSDTGKPDYEGFLSPLVIKEFGKYMHEHRKLEDGSLRDSDNWQKGIPRNAYMKSMWRHFHDLWTLHRGYEATDHTGKKITIEEALCAMLFNVQGYLHEHLKSQKSTAESPAPRVRRFTHSDKSDEDLRFSDYKYHEVHPNGVVRMMYREREAPSQQTLENLIRSPYFREIT